jgi:hypothetical protein
MEGWGYDLHIHTCLSPCGDDDMTPPNVANMAALMGLRVIAVTDHNSCRNAGAVMEAARSFGLPLTVIPGMEVTTSEEVHVVCLFPTLEAGLAAGEEVEASLLPVKNDPAIFGNQLLMGPREELLGQVEKLLISATGLSVDQMPAFAAKYGGVAFPAHIDRGSNSVFSNLGFFPHDAGFRMAEVWRPEVFFAQGAHRDILERYPVLINSDAHRLGELKDPGTSPPLWSGGAGGRDGAGACAALLKELGFSCP